MGSGEIARGQLLKEKPRLYLCRSDKGIEELVSASRSRSEEFVLLLDYAPQLSRRLIPALINAKVRYREKSMHARTMQMETLLFAAGTMNAGNAIKNLGMKSSGRFIAFSTSEAVFKKFSKRNNVRIVEELQLKFDHDVAGEVALTALSQ